MIGLLQLNLGNIASVERMISKAGGNTCLITDPKQLYKVSKLILPGVGHFDAGMKQLNNLGFAEVLLNLIKEDSITVMGICLGMQLLCRSSEEGHSSGLGLIQADVLKFRESGINSLKSSSYGLECSFSCYIQLLASCKFRRAAFLFCAFL